jgi:hypothetical protein
VPNLVTGGTTEYLSVTRTSMAIHGTREGSEAGTHAGWTAPPPRAGP